VTGFQDLATRGAISSLPSAKTRLWARWLAGAVIVLVFGARLWHLSALPIFIDESVQLLWAKGLNEGRWARVLAGGKYLHVWAASWLVGLPDPLAWARRGAVALGGVSLWASYVLGRAIRDEATGLVAAALYATCPFAFFHERLSVADVYLSAAAALVLVASLRLAERPTLAAGVLAAVAVALGVLAKAFPGAVLAATPAVVWGLLSRPDRRPSSPLLLSYAILLPAVAYPVRFFVEKTHEVHKVASVDPWTYPALVLRNAGLAAEWLTAYLTIPVVLLAALGTGLAVARRDRRAVAALWAALSAILAVVLVARVWYPRYLLLATVPAVVLAASALMAVVRIAPPPARPLVLTLALAAVLAPGVLSDARLLVDPGVAEIPDGDRFQYIEGWPSGYGAREAADYLRGQAARVDVRTRVVMDDAADSGPWRGIEVSVMNVPRLELVAEDLTDEPTLRRELASADPTFLLLGRPSDGQPLVVSRPIREAARPAASFFNRNGERVVAVYSVPPAPARAAEPRP
jgi:hypothetical protein